MPHVHDQHDHDGRQDGRDRHVPDLLQPGRSVHLRGLKQVRADGGDGRQVNNGRPPRELPGLG